MELKIKRKIKPFENERLPTNTLSSGIRVQRWANFIAGFSVEFVENCLSDRSPKLDIVLDPFMGCGTTLLAARNLGFKSVGIEAHQLFVELSKAKLTDYTAQDLIIVSQLLRNKKSKIKWSEDAARFIGKMFAMSDMEKLAQASFQVGKADLRLRPLAVAIFLKAAEFSCTAQTDGIYKAPTSKKNNMNFTDALSKSVEIFHEDIKTDWYSSHWIHQPKPHVFWDSSLNLKAIKNSSVGVCITSPPYLNNFDYAEMTRLQLYLLGWSNSWADISRNVRLKLITNTTTALLGKKGVEFQTDAKKRLPKVLTSELGDIITLLQQERKIRPGKKEYDYLVYPYYNEIYDVIKEVYRCLKKDGRIHWVVADAALYGVHIKTHDHTKILLEAAGFKNIEIKWIRKRGHRWIQAKRDGAKEALGEYHIVGNK